jgi:plastocyanin
VKTFTWGLSGFAIGTLLILVPMVLVGHGRSAPQAAPAMPTMSSGMASMSSAGAAQSAAAAATRQIAIVHVQRGCHDWSMQGQMAAAMSLRLHRGDTLAIRNTDTDGHRLVQQAGPSILMRHARMMMNATSQLRFERSGVYRFTTHAFMLPNMPDVKTTGPDHHLMLVVRVA